MSIKKKTKLIILLIAEVTLIVINKVFDKPPSNINNWLSEAGWYYWAGLIVGLYLLYYIYNYDCKKCGAAQIWLSPNFLKWKWPKDNCWKCGAKQ